MVKVRRVVMGHDASGKSVVLDDRVVDPVTTAFIPGMEIHRIWEQDEPAVVPVTEVAPPSGTRFYPGPGGFRFGFLTVPPGVTYEPPPGLDMNDALSEMEAKLPGMAATFDFSRPGDHTTDTVDFVVVASGEGRMVSGDSEIVLKAGDCVIQNGTAHAWFNDGTEPFVLAYALLGATRGA